MPLLFPASSHMSGKQGAQYWQLTAYSFLATVAAAAACVMP